ncbi:hypothetical protein HAX54_020299, partial [Datura stramonium]|nr:hypothetical protein [Datura stramonium]
VVIDKIDNDDGFNGGGFGNGDSMVVAHKFDDGGDDFDGSMVVAHKFDDGGDDFDGWV